MLLGLYDLDIAGLVILFLVVFLLGLLLCFGCGWVAGCLVDDCLLACGLPIELVSLLLAGLSLFGMVFIFSILCFLFRVFFVITLNLCLGGLGMVLLGVYCFVILRVFIFWLLLCI